MSGSIGKRVGFFAGLMIFSSMLYFVGSKLHLFSLPYVYFISGIIVLHIVYSAALRKNVNGGFRDGFREFGHRVNGAVTVIVLVPVYFIGIGLTSVLGKIVGKKFLSMNPQGGSYWIDAKNDETMEEHRHSF